MILFIIGIIIHLLLFNAYDDISLISAILYHYSKLDIRFLMSLLFSIYWLSVLYKYVFQYLDIDTYIQIRLNFKEKIRFYIQRTLLFTILYIISQFIIVLYIDIYPWLDIFYNLLMYYICILIAYLKKKKKDYIFVVMLITLIILKLLSPPRVKSSEKKNVSIFVENYLTEKYGKHNFKVTRVEYDFRMTSLFVYSDCYGYDGHLFHSTAGD